MTEVSADGRVAQEPLEIWKNQDKVLRECALIGAAVLDAQKVEFALYGVISHLAEHARSRDKRFKNLDPEKFLRGDVKDLKATLGQLIKAYGHQLLLTTEELSQFVEDRNLIMHSYWRLTKARLRGGSHLENPEEFLIQFAKKCRHWNKVLRGLIALMKRQTAKKLSKEREITLSAEELSCIRYYEQNAEKHLAQQSGLAKRRLTPR